MAKYTGHAHRQARRAPGAGKQTAFAHVACQLIHLLYRHGKAPTVDFSNGVHRLAAHHPCWAVDGEEHAWLQHGGGDHGHDGNETF